MEDFNDFDLDREIEKWGKHIPFQSDEEMIDDRTYDAIARHFFEVGRLYGIWEQWKTENEK